MNRGSQQSPEYKLAMCGFVFYAILAILGYFLVQMAITLDFPKWEPYYYVAMDLLCFSNPYALLICSSVVREHVKKLVGRAKQNGARSVVPETKNTLPVQVITVKNRNDDGEGDKENNHAA